MAREGGGRLGMEIAAEKAEGEELERENPSCVQQGLKNWGNFGCFGHSLDKPRSELCPAALCPINLVVAGRKEQEDAQSLSLPCPQGISIRSQPCPSLGKLWL